MRWNLFFLIPPSIFFDLAQDAEKLTATVHPIPTSICFCFFFKIVIPNTRNRFNLFVLPPPDQMILPKAIFASVKKRVKRKEPEKWKKQIIFWRVDIKLDANSTSFSHLIIVIFFSDYFVGGFIRRELITQHSTTSRNINCFVYAVLWTNIVFFSRKNWEIQNPFSDLWDSSQTCFILRVFLLLLAGGGRIVFCFWPPPLTSKSSSTLHCSLLSWTTPSTTPARAPVFWNPVFVNRTWTSVYRWFILHDMHDMQ